MRTTIDFSPLYRSAIGFDRVASLLDAAAGDAKPGYPPYDVERVEENQYRITMAVAGFTEADIDITSEQNSLIIAGKRGPQSERDYLYQGIAGRDFERKFQLAEHVVVEAAKLEHGLLHVELRREIPEAMKPRKIAIAGASQPALEGAAA